MNPLILFSASRWRFVMAGYRPAMFMVHPAAAILPYKGQVVPQRRGNPEENAS
ncbi:MAG: hypothetical protein H7A20_07785 [Rhodanobacteraceae bacterium]|nr:hypothetical protein [Xanthomonadales bacterium]MCP5478665.1 hypothetical protein [Rhodanobacteraceae bacterium]HPF72026.1 hypothetical protein [Xanthomonadaceae bacterium]HRX98823.1 hypothetical protein [Xanthomonadaceae bacterium]